MMPALPFSPDGLTQERRAQIQAERIYMAKPEYKRAIRAAKYARLLREIWQALLDHQDNLEGEQENANT